MKLIEIISLAVVAVFATSCEKNENQNQNQNQEPGLEVNLSEAVAGTYTGYSTAEFQYSSTPMVSQSQTLTVTAEDGGTVSVSYTSDTWGTFTMAGAAVTESGGTYALNGSGKTVMGMSADSQSEYDCTLTAEISGTDDFSFVFDVPAVMGGLKITLLPGNPPAELLISGSYTGTLTMSVMGTAMDPMEEAQVSLAAEGDVWTLTLPEMGMGTMSMESISVEVELAESADGYTLSAESIEAVSGETSITGSLTGTVSADGSTMTLSAEITPGAMPMAINVDFEGTK
ncbi:MAG TPA: calycin-like domain-containing protein [Candidatus Coprenecus pullistercoris]|nr:calycin-like domain-containing protein [Candidatus Coprenecus pullistercoris]